MSIIPDGKGGRIQISNRRGLKCESAIDAEDGVCWDKSRSELGEMLDFGSDAVSPDCLLFLRPSYLSCILHSPLDCPSKQAPPSSSFPKSITIKEGHLEGQSWRC